MQSPSIYGYKSVDCEPRIHHSLSCKHVLPLLLPITFFAEAVHWLYTFPLLDT